MTDVDNFEKGLIDPRIYKELATDMWYVTVSYLPIKDVLKLPLVCKYFNEEVVWHKWSGRLLWGEMPHIDERVFKGFPLENPPSETALMHACKRSAPLKHILALVNSGVTINSVNSKGESSLRMAHKEYIVRLLLEANANPNISDADGHTPLIAAVSSKQMWKVLLLIQHNANVNQVNNYGYTALMHAAMYREVDMSRVLLDEGADVTIINSIGKTALNYGALCAPISIMNQERTK